MRQWTRILRACLAVLAALALTACATNQTTCRFGEVAAFPVTYLAGGVPVITIQVGGKDQRMIVDTGAAVSFIDNETAKHLGVRYVIRDSRLKLIGVGGMHEGALLTLQNVEIGQASLESIPLVIGGIRYFGSGNRTLNDGILGNNILTRFDIAFDLPNNRITFFLSTGCEGTDLTPWTGSFDVETLGRDRGDRGASVPYDIDGKPLHAVIDSGFSLTEAFQAALSRNGIVPAEAPANDYTVGRGYGPGTIISHRERFASLEIGAEDYTDPWLDVADNPIGRFTDVIIGEDYLHSHRVFISNSTGKVFLGLALQQQPLTAR